MSTRTEAVRPPDTNKVMRVTTPSAAVKTKVEWDQPYAGGSKKGITGYEVRAHVLNRAGEWIEQFWQSSADKGKGSKLNNNNNNNNSPTTTGARDKEAILQAVVRDMRPSSAFRVSVRAQNEAGWGEWGPEFEFMSGPRVEPPQPVDWKSMRLTEATFQSFKVAWAEPESVGAWVEEYCLQFGTDGIHWSPHYRTNGDTQQLLLDGLQPGTRYYVRAKARNAAGWGR